MGAVALLKKDEELLESLKEDLDLPSKSQVIHLALAELQTSVERRCLAEEVRLSAEKCSEADAQEHDELTGAAYSRLKG